MALVRAGQCGPKCRAGCDLSPRWRVLVVTPQFAYNENLPLAVLPASVALLDLAMPQRFSKIVLLPTIGCMSWLLCCCASAQPNPTEAVTFARDIRPFFAKHCFTCHGEEKQNGEVALHTFMDKPAVLEERALWTSAYEMLKFGAMPPEDRPQPTKAERAQVVGWLEANLFALDCTQRIDPGRVTIRRLNRNEYNNTIRDLFGIDLRPADDFPADDVGAGFDNIGDVLSLPPLLLEKYLDAAEQIARHVIQAPEDLASQATFLSDGQLQGQQGAALRGGIYHMYSVSTVFAELEFPQDGDYHLVVEASADFGGNEFPKLDVRLDGAAVGLVEVKTNDDEYKLYELRKKVSGGKHRLSARFVNDYYEPKAPDPDLRDRNVYIRKMGFTGPLDVKTPQTTAAHRRLVTSQPGNQKPLSRAAREVLTPFLSRCFRRPVNDAEVTPFVSLVETANARGESFERGLQVAVMASLVSPHFLFRLELDGASPNDLQRQELNAFQLASRMSYFLWSSMPDAELSRLAEQGKLSDARVLKAQMHRMLRDEKAAALVENFAGQWLNLRNLAEFDPDAKQFADFDDALRAAMLQETFQFFAEVMRRDRSILTFIDGDFTFVNERLAKHYGLTGVQGDAFRRVSLSADSQRVGVLTHGSILALTSNPNRTSPVKRGKWVLENLLGTPPPDPPADVPTLEESAKAASEASFREQLEIHRKNPVCASCHREMDAIGFGLENFDPIGRFREKEGEHQIDASGTLPDGQSFRGAVALAGVLKRRSDDFSRCLTEKMLTYALGRGLKFEDQCEVKRITKELEKNDYRFSVLVWEILRSELFRMRRGEGEES